jgi:hypothetical protein
MATMSILPLDEAIDTLIHLTRDVSSLSPKASGKLYLASLAFLCHLNVDQETIHKKLYVFVIIFVNLCLENTQDRLL